MIIQIKRNDSDVAAFRADEQTVFHYQLMGQHKINAHFQTTDVLPIQIGDYIEYESERYYINMVPACTRISQHVFEYNINFEAEIYRLYDKIFMDEGAAEFSYFGQPSDFISLLLTNINDIYTGWTVGDMATLPPKNIVFSNVNCRQALNQIADEFGLEYFVSGKKISLVKLVGNDTVLEFEYGEGKGLYKLSRKIIDDKNIVTRVYGFGSDKNLSSDYGHKRLRFTKSGKHYLEENVNLYGVKEGQVTFDDIYPHRNGTVTAIDGQDFQQITDSSIDFDLNGLRIDGKDEPSIVFQTGDLAGMEFQIGSYDNDNKIIRFNTFTESDGSKFPNDTFKPSVGDEYTLVNIKMPQSYIDSAEQDLKDKTQDYIDENSIPRITYGLDIDRFYAEDKNLNIQVGDRVKVKDVKLGVNATIRTSAISFPLVDPYDMKATIADTIPYTIQEKLIAKTVDNKKVIKEVDRTRSEASRRNMMRTRELQDLVFDPDGYFDPGNIKPESIETLMLSVGAKSQNFNLSGVRIEANYNGDKNKLHISAGHLIHNEVEIEGLGYDWNIVSKTFTGLSSSKAYYVYAKCSQTALTGTWHISETPLKTDDIAGYWVFNLGVLYAVADSRRDFAFTNGMTFINGDTITTGRIKDGSGQNYFDLQDGKFNLGDSQSGLDWDVANGDRLTIRGGLTQNAGGKTSVLGVYRGDYNASATYYEGDTVFYNGNTYRWIDGASGNHQPPNVTYWAIDAAKGDTGEKGDKGDAGAKGEKGDKGEKGNPGEDGVDGTDGNWIELRFAKNGSTSTAPSLTNTEKQPAGWSVNPPAVGDLEYLWMTKAEKTTAGSLVINWSDPVRIKGEKGAKGNKGDKGVKGEKGDKGNVGPSLVFRKLYDNGETYHGDSTHVEAVEYNNHYYVTRVDAGSFSGKVPTNTNYWNDFGSEFESVATGLLLAKMSYIENLVVGVLSTNFKRNEQTGESLKAYLKSDANNSEIDFWDVGTKESDESNKLDALVRIGKGVGYMQSDSGNRAGASARKGDDYTELTSGGIFTNGGNVPWKSVPPGPITNAGIVSLLEKKNSYNDGISSAIVGVDRSSPGSSRSYGGWFNSLFTGALYLPVKIVNTGFYQVEEDECFIVYNGGAGTKRISTPTSPKKGRVLIIRPRTSVEVYGFGYDIVTTSGSPKSSFNAGNGDMKILIFDGSYWQEGRFDS